MVYVDNDPEAVNQSYGLLARENATNVAIIEEDLRHPDAILDHPDTRRLIDFDKPVGLLTIAVWPFISDDESPYDLMACYRERIASGSYIVMSHSSLDEVTEEVKEMLTAIARSYDKTRDPFTHRSREQLTAFFDGLTVLDPGIVHAPDWRPTEPVDIDDPARPATNTTSGGTECRTTVSVDRAANAAQVFMTYVAPSVNHLAPRTHPPVRIP